MRLAIVTPWYGAELIGGAERLAWDLSHALARGANDVDVLTTCCRSFHDDWSANYYPAGTSKDDGVTVRRFKVDARDRVAFSRAGSALLALRRDELRRDRPPLPLEKSRAFVEESIKSRALLRHLQERGTSYDAVLFLPYLYGTTLEGLPLVADRALLVPCLHDEAYAYLDEVRDCFRRARGLLFNSEGERDVAASLYGPWVHFRSSVIGHAVDVVQPPVRPIAIHGFVPQHSRYVLFLGRVDPTKNADLALEAFARFRTQRRTTSMQFVLAGPHAPGLRTGDGIVDLGAVTEDEKAALLAHARALVQPSTNESFSRTVYEAWHLRRPVIVHADCPATADLVEESGGGWQARTVEDWAKAFATLDESSDTDIDGAGMRGRAVALRMGTWDDVAATTLQATVELLRARDAGPAVALQQWAGRRAASPFYDDGALNVLSLAPLRSSEVPGFLEILANLRRKTRAVRAFVHEEDCSPAVQSELLQLAGSLGPAVSVVVLADVAAARFAALRDAHVACAFGAPLERSEPLLEAMWFDLPIVAYDDAVARTVVEPCGIICERGDLKTAAELLHLAANDARLRGQVVAEARRVRVLASEASSPSRSRTP